MSKRIYQVIMLGKSQTIETGHHIEPMVYDTYDAAIDAFNERINVINNSEPVKQPAREQPLRQVFKNFTIELWIVHCKD